MSRVTLTEADIAADCDRLALALGYQVERYEQRRATRIHEGLPDRRYVHAGRGVRVWVELKRPGGKLTRAQHGWLSAELAAGGLAAPVDDPEQLRRIFQACSRLSGRGMAMDICGELCRLTAMRGYRDGVTP